MRDTLTNASCRDSILILYERSVRHPRASAQIVGFYDLRLIRTSERIKCFLQDQSVYDDIVNTDVLFQSLHLLLEIRGPRLQSCNFGIFFFDQLLLKNGEIFQ